MNGPLGRKSDVARIDETYWNPLLIVKLLQIWDGYNPFFVFATRVEMLCWYDIHFSEKEIIRVKTQRSVRAVCELNTFGAGFFIVQEDPQNIQ